MTPLRPFDLQVNGYAGADFSDPSLPLDACRAACEALAADGVDGILATVITAPLARMQACLRRLCRHREADPLVQRLITGFHVEGPFLNGRPGYVGAHDPQAILPATPDVAARLVEAGEGLVRLLTLAPESDAGQATTRWLVGQGIRVSAGHTDASREQLAAAIDAGLSMVTHLGNGCPTMLPRHDNAIQRLLARAADLWVCFIPDGVHVPWFALGNYLAIVGPERAIMVSDAIAAARLGPGRYRLADADVEVDAQGVARRPGSENLAGSTITMPQIRTLLASKLGCDETTIAYMVDANPRAAVGIG